jgi:hypothetical protein
MRLSMKGVFQRHDLENVCAREAVPVWDGNLSYTAKLPTQNELFYCDESYAAMVQQRRNWKILAAFVICGAAIARLWFWRQNMDRNGYIPIQFQQLREETGADSFRKATDL